MNIDTPTSDISYLGSPGQRLARRQNTAARNFSESETAYQPPHIVFCGGFHSNMLGTKAEALAEFCSANEWAYTRFDYRGHGESDGDPDAFNLHDWLSDTLQVIDSCEQTIVLVGSSMGAWLATQAALKRTNKVKGLLLLAAAPDFLQELVEPRLTAADIWDLQQDKTVSIPSAYNSPYPLTQALLDSGKELALLSTNATENLACPVRLLHGTHDLDVPFNLSIRLMEGISHENAQLLLLHKADHRLADERSLKQIKSELSHLIKTL